MSGRGSPEAGPLHVVHVVRALNRGGVESWLLHVLRGTDPAAARMTFLVHTAEPGALDDEVLRHGARIVCCPRPRRPLAYALRLWPLLGELGPPDVVHSHVHHFSGLVLLVARLRGVRLRVAHSHSDTSSEQAASPLGRRLYFALAKALIRRCSNLRLACSPGAARALFGPGWERDPAVRIVPYGIDLAPFGAPRDRDALRARLGIPARAFVLGHVGNFRPAKNHPFLLRVGRELLDRSPGARIVLVGTGPGLEPARRTAARLGIADRVLFLGERGDVPSLMSAVFDALALPSLTEGLPLVGIEAQAAGLPLFVSEAVGGELDVIPALVHRMPLAAGPSAWAGRILSAPRRPLPRDRALERVRESRFSVERSIRALLDSYGAAMPPS